MSDAVSDRRKKGLVSEATFSLLTAILLITLNSILVAEHGTELRPDYGANEKGRVLESVHLYQSAEFREYLFQSSPRGHYSTQRSGLC